MLERHQETKRREDEEESKDALKAGASETSETMKYKK